MKNLSSDAGSISGSAVSGSTLAQSVSTQAWQPTAPRGLARFLKMNSATGHKLTNWQAVKFYDIYRSLHRMSDLPDGDEYHLNKAVTNRAMSFLGYLDGAYEVTAPRILPEDDESVSFTWEQGDVKHYLMVGVEEIDVLVLNKKNHFKCEYHIDDSSADEVLTAVFSRPKVSSSVSDAS